MISDQVLVRALLGLAALGAAGLGCADDQPDPTGDLERPASMVVLERSGDPNAELGEARADLLIVDSEAQGVRVQQYLQSKTRSGTSTLTVRQTEFVLGPAMLFPMVVPAEGFPTEIAAIASRDRAYTIAPAAARRVPHSDADLAGKPNLLGKKDPNAPTEGRLYVHDVTEATSFPGRASDGGNLTLGFMVIDDPDRPAVPVDVLAWPTEDTSVDRVLVLFDELDGTGRVVAYDVDVDAAPPMLEPLGAPTPADLVAPSVVFEVEVSSAPRQLVALPAADSDPQTLLIANAGGDEVGQLIVDGDAATFTPVPGVGPTSRVIPVDATHALALRTDEATVVVLEADDSGVFAVSAEGFESPYRDPALRGAASPGRIDLPEIAVSGARGTPSGFPSIEDAETVGVVMLVLVDGTSVFLRGDDLSLVVSEASEVAVVRSTQESADGTYIRECGAAELNWCVDADDPPEVCTGLVRSARAEDAVYSARFQGDLVSTRQWFFQGASDDHVAGFELLSNVETRHAVQMGDRFLLQGTSPCVRRAGVDGVLAGPWRVEGEVAVAADAAVSVQLTSLRGGGDDLDLAAQGALDFTQCEDLARLEILPADPVVVLAEVEGDTVVEVHARVDVQPGLSGLQIARIESRPDGGPAPLAFTLVSPPEGFQRVEGGIEDRACVFDSECGAGRRCVESNSTNADGTCPRRCDCIDSGCADDELVWRRSGVELRVTAAQVESQDLGSSDLRGERTSAETVNAVPYETVWLEVWNQWVTSFPGSRTLIRLEYGSESQRAGVTR